MAFPRINSHCNELLYTGVGNHVSADIAVVIDLFSGGYFIYMISINIAILMYTTTDEYLEIVKKRWHKVSSKNHATMIIILPFWLILLFFISEGWYFGHPLIPEEGAYYLTRSMSILHSPTGFGAAMQILIATVVSSAPEYVYIFWALVKEDMAKDRGTS